MRGNNNHFLGENTFWILYTCAIWGMVGVADFRLIVNHSPGLRAFPILFSLGMTWQILLFLPGPDPYVNQTLEHRDIFWKNTIDDFG